MMRAKKVISVTYAWQLLDVIGKTTTQFFINFMELVFFIVTVLRRGFSFIRKNKQNALIKNAVVREIIFDGVDTLIPTIMVMSIIIGFSVIAQLIMVLQALGSETEAVIILIRYVALELSPLLTAIVVICRSGSASAIVFGNMSINQEVKGLELLGIDVLVYLAFPCLLGIAISQISLSVYFATLSGVLGIFFSAIFDSPSNLKYFSILIESINPMELIFYLIKNMLFGLIIGGSACFHGLSVKLSVTEVPQRTQKAIMNSLLYVLIINALFIL
jgi:phospholipid/cholesterol/gamma-HCH transport system permease protein